MRALLIIALLAAPVQAKDLSRVPASPSPLPRVTSSVEVCRSDVTATVTSRATRLHNRLWKCYRIPMWVNLSPVIGWTNVFRELQRARECGVPPFSNRECHG
jgi:hypothetical protein